LAGGKIKVLLAIVVEIAYCYAAAIIQKLHVQWINGITLYYYIVKFNVGVAGAPLKEQFVLLLVTAKKEQK
jgi:hypothetical protein